MLYQNRHPTYRHTASKFGQSLPYGLIFFRASTTVYEELALVAAACGEILGPFLVNAATVKYENSTTNEVVELNTRDVLLKDSTHPTDTSTPSQPLLRPTFIHTLSLGTSLSQNNRATR